MKSLRYFALAALPVFLAGCAPHVNLTPTAIEYVKPPVGSTATVYMGEPIVKSATGFKTDAIELGNAKGVYSKISAGTYCNVGNGIYRNVQNPQSVILTDLYGNTMVAIDYVKFDPVKNIVSATGASTYNSSEISIKRIPDYLCIVSKSLVRTIEYNGNASGVLKFTYREFSNDMARQAYTTDFTVDSKGSDTVTYKGARIKVLRADNSSINYTLISGFDTSNGF